MSDVHFEINKNRTDDIQFGTILAGDGSALVLASDDVIRFKMWLPSSLTVVLDLDSVGATANGSVVEKASVNPAVVNVRVAQGDSTGLYERVYQYELSVVDNSETSPADAIKVIQRGTINVVSTPSGDVGVS